MPNKMKRRVGLRARMPHCPTVGRGERGEGRGGESCEPAAAAAPGLALGVSSLADAGLALGVSMHTESRL